MKNEEKSEELLTEMVKGQDRLIGEVTEMKDQLSGVKYEISLMKTEVKEEIIKLNLITSENSRSILRLADEIHLVAEHEKRISKLESVVFK